jgi:hypothetical protein
LIDREAPGLDLLVDPGPQLGLRLDVGPGVLGGIDEGVGTVLAEVAGQSVDDCLPVLLLATRADAHSGE